MSEHAISDDELQVLKNVDFLLNKRIALAKIRLLLESTRVKLEWVWKDSPVLGSNDPNIWSGKISQGENYRGLPYLILDYPAVFQGEDIFAARTMFWWGHFFSTTLHLQGIFLEQFREQLRNSLAVKPMEAIYICTADSPWHYHYGEDNYQKLDSIDLAKLLQRSFLKLSQPIELSQWESLPMQAETFFREMCSLLSDDRE